MTAFKFCGTNAASGSLTAVVNVTATTAENDTLLLGVLTTTSISVTGVTDTQGNAWTLKSSNTVNLPFLFVFECAGASALVSGTDTLTVTYSANTSSVDVTGVDVPNSPQASDKLVTATGTTGSPSVATGTLSATAETLVAFEAHLNTGGAPAWTGGFTSTDTEHNGTAAYLSASQQNSSTTTTKTAGATITSTAWNIIAVTYPNAPVTVTSVLSDAIQGQAYSQTLTASGGTGTYTWAVTSGTLPTGLSLSSGVISGTTSVAAGIYSFTVQATDGASNTGSAVLSIEVDALGTVSVNAFKNVQGNGNLLSVADMAGSAGFTWTADINAGAPFVSTHMYLDGTGCMGWQATTFGDTSIKTGNYAVKPNKGYIASGWMLSTGNNPVQIGVYWKNGGGTVIGTSFGTAFTAPGASIWQPVNVQLTSPSGAASADLVAYVQGADAGDLELIDLAFLGGPVAAQVLVDWINSPLVSAGEVNAAGSSFMDVSPWLRMDQGVSLTRGRQDAISEMGAGSAVFQLQNDTGVFSRLKSTALAGPVTGGNLTLQRRCQVNTVDEQGNWWTRFDGPIAEIDYAGDNTGNTNIATVNCTDILGVLSRADSLDCWTRELVRNDGAALTWTLDDSGNVGHFGQAAESSGNNGPALRAYDKDTSGVAVLNWQDSSAGVETLADAVAILNPDGSEFWSAGMVAPSSQLRGLDSGTVGPYTSPLGSINVVPQFTANPNGKGSNQFVSNTGYCLFGQLPLSSILNPKTNDGTTDFSAEIWFMADASGTSGGQCLNTAMANGTQVGPYIALSLGSSRTGYNVCAGAYMNNTSSMNFELAYYKQPPSFIQNTWKASVLSPIGSVSQAWVPDRPATTNGNNVVVAGGSLPHHLVLVCAGDPVAPTLTMWLDGSIVGSVSLNTGQSFDTIYIGSAFGGQGCWSGNLSVCSLYNFQLSPQQIVNHAAMGQYGMWEQTTDNCVNQLATYANIPSFWQNLTQGNLGLSLTDYQDITGSNALTNMQLFEQAEMGLIFVNNSGQLTFHTRDWRMGYGAPNMLLPPDTFDADMGLEVLDQFMCNEAAASTSTYQTGAGYINKPSKDAYGDYTLSSIDSPTQLPLITWSRAYALLGMPNLAFWPDPNLTDYAAWLANSRGDPWLVPGNLTIDFLSPDLAAGCPPISSWYALDIDNVIAPTGTMPTSFADVNLSSEWFIEGINETISNTQRQLTIYCSPAEPQRAWIPGDSTYGVLGTTARVGISGPDLNTVLVQAKDVSHDGGPPYVSLNTVAMAAGTLNNPSLNGHDFIGATDLRSIYANLQQVVEPPLLVVGAVSNQQSLAAGSSTTPEVVWDTIFVDTANGMGAINGWPNWYVVTVPGFYEIDVSALWSLHASGETGSGQTWIVVAYKAAQLVAANAGTPLSATSYICPIGEQQPFNNNSDNCVQNPTTVLYLGVGDMIGVGMEQGSGGAHTLGTSFGGTKMSLRWISNSVYADHCRANTSIANGGTVTDPALQVPQSKTYNSTASYLYYGNSSTRKNPGRLQRVNTNGNCWQGCTINGEGKTGSQYGTVKMPFSTIAADWAGGIVTNATLTVTRLNAQSNAFVANCTLMLGWTSNSNVGAYTWSFNHSGDHPDLTYLQMPSNPYNAQYTGTFNIPISIANAFVTGGARAFTYGNNSTNNIDFYGAWKGWTNWTLTMNGIA